MPDRSPDAVVTREDDPAAPAVLEAAPRSPVSLPRADVAALVAAVGAPLLGAALTLAGQTWLTVALLVLVPLIVVVYGLGLLVLVRALRRRSVLRRELGFVPARYRGYAWLWAVAFLAAAVAPMLGGFDLPWALQAGLVGLSVVAVGVVTGAMWSTYLRDVAWVEAERED